MLPANAGITRLINQIPVAVNIMPIVFALTNPINRILSSPRNPNSAKAIVGMMANTRNITHNNHANETQLASTLKTCNNNKYCKTNTRYLINERLKILVNSLQ